MSVLVTGGCGFAGHHLVEHLLATTNYDVVVLDSLTYAGRTDRLTDIDGYNPDRVRIVWHDLRAPLPNHPALEDVAAVLHLAAESHVDRSIVDPVPFVTNNILATLNLCEWARHRQLTHFVQISTDEVYGPAAEGHAHVEWEPAIPSNPYAASKAGQEAIAISYWRTYGLPVVITNTMNLIGERQHVEKMVPLSIRAIVKGEMVTVHADANKVPGERHWLHARNHADALCWILDRQPARYGNHHADRPDRWHIAGDEVDNLALVNMIGDIIGTCPRVKFINFHQARPGHDRRYALDSSKIAAAGWKPPLGLVESLRRTVRWSIQHPEWLGLTDEDVQSMRDRQVAVGLLPTEQVA